MTTPILPGRPRSFNPSLPTIVDLAGAGPIPLVNDLNRRSFLASLAAAGLLTACGSTPSVPDQPAAGWSFTDDRGVEVKRPSRPSRIAAYAAAGGALVGLGVRPVAIFSGAPMDQEPGLEGLDLTGIESAGEIYGEPNVEKLAALGVDLVVTAFDPLQTGPIFGFKDGTVQSQVERIAPIVAINGIADPGDVIARFVELAAALGANLQAPAVTAARQRYDDAREAVRAAVADKPDLLAVALYADASAGISFYRPGQSAATRQFLELGMQMVEPEGEPADINEDFTGFFAETVSLEQTGKYPADLILLDRTEPEDMAGIATWDALPAVLAGQLVGYSEQIKWTYNQQADELEAIADAVRSANPDLVGPDN